MAAPAAVARALVVLLVCLPLLAAAPQTAPPTPSGFSGTVQSTSAITWTWGNVSGETGYVVRDGTGDKQTLVADVTTWAETGLLENENYSRWVVAQNGPVFSGASNTFSRYTFAHQVGDSDWVLEAISSTVVRIRITTPPRNSTSGQTGVQILWWNAPGNRWDTVQARAPNYTVDHSVASASFNQYTILFYNGDAWPNAAYSPIKTITTPATPPPTVPTNVAAVPGNGSVSLSWTASTGATSYLVRRATASGGPYTDLAAAGTTFSDTGRTNFQPYYYVVRAVGPGGQSSNSTEVRATPHDGSLTALLVVGNTTLGSGDAAVKDRLILKGYVVTVKSAASATSADATANKLVLTSATCLPADLGTKFRNVSTAVLTWNNANLGDLGMTSTAAGNFGSLAGQTQISISTAASPLAAGLTGTPMVVSSPQAFTWGMPNAAGVKVATISGDSTRSTLFCYDVAAAMPGLVAPARRVGFFLSDVSAGSLTTQGWQLFDAALVWAVSASVPPLAPASLTRSVSTSRVDLSWSAATGATSYTVKRSTGSGGPYNPVQTLISGTSFADTTVVNGTGYYYVVTAVNGAGESPASGQVSGTPIAAPASPAALPSNAQITICWQPVSGATAYSVKRGTVNGGPYGTVTSGIVGGTLVQGSLANNTTYYYVVTATNSGGESVASVQVSAMPTAATPTALLVVGNATLVPGDDAIRTRLQSLGYTVTVIAAAAATSADAGGKRLVIVTSTVASTDAGAKFQTVTTPVITWENAILDDLKMTGPTAGTDFGTTSAQTQLSILASSHPVAAGLFGTPTLSTAGIAACWGVPSAAAVKIAALSADPNKWPIFVYEVGSPMVGLSAPGRRVGFFLDDAGPTLLTNEGWQLFDGAVLWASASAPSSPSAPGGLTAIASNRGVELQWSPVSGISLYRIKRATSSGGPFSIVGQCDTPSYSDVGLVNGTTYYYVVCAVGPGGEGPASSTKSAVPVGPPPRPERLIATPGNQRVSLSWNAAAGATSYKIKWATLAGGPYMPLPTDETDLDAVVQGLQNTRSYYFIVTASNQWGEGPPSVEASAIPLNTPLAPTGLTATPSAGRITLNWTASTGSTSYKVRRSKTAGGPYTDVATAVGASPYADVSALNGVRYYYVVVGTNSGGDGPQSNEANTQIQAAPALAPSTVWLVPKDRGFSISWSFIEGATSYNIKRSQISGGPYPTIGSSSSGTYSDVGLTADTIYYYVVSGVNAWGEGPSSPQVPGTAVGLPPVPTGFSATTLSSSSIRYNWTDVAGEDQYVVEALFTFVGWIGFATAPANATTVTLTGLQDNIQYSSRLRSSKSGLLGNPSAIVGPFTQIRQATAADFNLWGTGPNEVTVRVGLPNNADQGQTAVEIQSSPNNSAWTTISAMSPVYDYTERSLTLGATRWYRIKFRGHQGEVNSAYSTSKSVVVGAIPQPPSSGSAVVKWAGTMDFTWTDGLGATGYQFRWPDGRVVDTRTSKYYTESGLAENTAYTRTVFSYNSTGFSSTGTSITGVPWLHDPTPAEFTLRSISQTSIQVDVSPPLNFPTTGQTGVAIRRSTDGSSWAVIRDHSNSYSYLNNTGLSAGQKYYYSIQFRNQTGALTAWSLSQSIIAVPAPVITSAGRKTRLATPQINGTADAGTTVRVYLNGVDRGAAVLTGTTWTFTCPSLTDGYYDITARATLAATTSSDSNSIGLTIDRTPPSAPKNVRSKAYNRTIDIDWDASPEPDMAGYLIFRKTGSTGTYTLLNPSKLVIGTFYRDSSAVNGTSYFYKVQALDDSLPN